MKDKILEEQIRIAKDWHSMTSLGILTLETLKILGEGHPRYRLQIQKIHDEVMGGGNISASMDKQYFHPLFVGMVGISEDILANEGNNTLKEALHKAYSALELELQARNKKYGNEAVFYGHLASLTDLPYEKKSSLTKKTERALWVIGKTDYFPREWRDAIKTVENDFCNYRKETRANVPHSLAEVMWKHKILVFLSKDIEVIESAKEKNLVAVLNGLAHCYQIVLGKDYSSSTVNSIFDKHLYHFINHHL